MSIIEVKNLDEYEIQKLEIYRDREEEKDGILTPPPPPQPGPFLVRSFRHIFDC